MFERRKVAVAGENLLVLLWFVRIQTLEMRRGYG